MSPSPIALLEQTLTSWKQWPLALSVKPKLQATLSAGRSHCSFLVVSESVFFVVRIESEGSRALAIQREHEHRLLKQLGDISPNFVWANDYALVTEYRRGRHWIAPNHLPQLIDRLRTLHQQKVPIGDFNLLDHADRYWAKLPEFYQQKHMIFFRYQRKHLEKTLGLHPQQCLCHNDLIAENIIQNGDEFTFIDWEYAAYNSPYFDLATLVEFAPLSGKQAMQISHQYWGSDDKQHLSALADFRQIVRFIEWLWESLQAPDKAVAVKKRLDELSV